MSDINQMIKELNQNNELVGEFADEIIRGNKKENEKTRLLPPTGGTTHKDAILLLLQTMLDSEEFDIDKLLELMVHEGCQMLCKYCITAKFIAVDRRSLVYHLLVNHNFKWPEVESSSSMKSTIVKILAFVFSYEHPNDVFRWMEATWSNRPVQCTNCPTVHQPRSKSKKFCGTGLFFKHWLAKHPNELITCNMCNGSFGYAGSYLSHKCVGTSILYFPQGVTIEDNSKDVELMHYECGVCPPNRHRTFPSFFNFFMHVRQEHNACEGCLKEFPSQSKLKAHVGELSHCASVRPTCWKCEDRYFNPDTGSSDDNSYYQTPRSFNSQEDLSLHELMAEPHRNDKLKVRCEICSISKVWFIHHFCNHVKAKGRPPLKVSENQMWVNTCDSSSMALARSIENIDPVLLEQYALESINEQPQPGQQRPNNPFIGMEKTNIFYTLQKFAQPLGRAWCLQWWWRASPLQHLLMLTRHVLDPRDLPGEAMETDILARDLELSDDSDEEKMESEELSIPSRVSNGEENLENGHHRDEEVGVDVYCLCKRYRIGSKMWNCGGGPDCPYSWFHYDCKLPKKTVGNGMNAVSYCEECAQKLA